MFLPKFTLPFALLAFTAAAPLAHAANIVTNGDFSTGDLTGWTSNSSIAFPWVSTGSWAMTGCIGTNCISGTPSEQSFLEQNLATVAGDSYTLSFDYASGGSPSELKTLFNGVSVSDLIDTNTNASFVNISFPGLVATSSNTLLEFRGATTRRSSLSQMFQWSTTGRRATARFPSRARWHWWAAA